MDRSQNVSESKGLSSNEAFLREFGGQARDPMLWDTFTGDVKI